MRSNWSLSNIFHALPLIACLSLFLVPTMLHPQCSATLSELPHDEKVIAILPKAVYEGTVTIFRVTGTNLPNNSKIQICAASKTAVSQENLPTLKMDTSSPSTLQAYLSVNPGAAGDYAVYIVSGDGKVYDSGQTLTVTPSDSNYVTCAGPLGSGTPNPSLECQFVPLSYKAAEDVFGKGVASRFIVVQVIIQNKNPNLEFLLQGIRLGGPRAVFSSYDKAIPRAVSEKEEQFSARAMAIRLTATAASIVTGVAGFAGNDILQNAANILAGPGQAGLQSAIPNLSVAELSRMDDLGFSVKSAVIPKSSALALVAFMPSDTLPGKRYSKYTRADLSSFFLL